MIITVAQQYLCTPHTHFRDLLSAEMGISIEPSGGVSSAVQCSGGSQSSAAPIMRGPPRDIENGYINK